MSKVALSIVIVSYRCARLLRDCLSSLRADHLTGGDVEAIVVPVGGGGSKARARSQSTAGARFNSTVATALPP